MYDLLRGMFSNEYMATHSLAGGNKDKEPLPAGIVDMIIGQQYVITYSACICFWHKYYVFSLFTIEEEVVFC